MRADLSACTTPSPERPAGRSGRHSRFLKLLQPLVFCLLATQLQAQAQQASALIARHDALHEQLDNNPLGRPLYLESRESAGKLEGDIYARLQQDYVDAGPVLRDVASWCDILILHLNVKSCRTSTDGTRLEVRVGRKVHERFEDAYPIAFDYSVATTDPDYLQVILNAGTGPWDTHDYRIVLELAALKTGGSFMHLSYSYGYGLTASAAMKAYLSTVGRNKVGFTVTETDSGGQPVYLRGLRGVVERNTMRYYLAVESYLGALAAPAAVQTDQRLQAWYAGSEQYAVQLHELERDEYLSMKHEEIARQRSVEPVPAVSDAH